MGQKIASRLSDEIGENGARQHLVADLQILHDLIKEDIPSLDLSSFKKSFEDIDAKIKAGKTKPTRARLEALQVRNLISEVKATGEDAKAALLWLSTNKVQSFFCSVIKDLDTKMFSKESDGRWKVMNTKEGSRLSKFDYLVELRFGQNFVKVQGKSDKELGELLKKFRGPPKVCVHRQTTSKKQMYEALRLPPPNIKLTLWDMDLCLLKIHTGGHTNTNVQSLSKQVTEAYCYLMDILIAKGYPTGVVTFSDKAVARQIESNYGGEDLVRPLVFHALRRHWMQQDRTLKLEQAVNKARSYVEKDLYVRAAYPEWRNRHDPEFKENTMPNSKEWHINRVKEDYLKRTGKKLENKEVILFDDGERNIEEANKLGSTGVMVDDETGFTVRDWEEAMDLCWDKYLGNCE